MPQNVEKKRLFQKAKTKAFYAKAFAFPLYLLFIPTTLVILVYHIVTGIASRLWSMMIRRSPAVIISSSFNKKDQISPYETDQTLCPLKLVGPYVGDIFGFYLNFWGGFKVLVSGWGALCSH